MIKVPASPRHKVVTTHEWTDVAVHCTRCDELDPWATTARARRHAERTGHQVLISGWRTSRLTPQTAAEEQRS